MQPTERLQPVAGDEAGQGSHLALGIGFGALCVSLIAAAILRPALLRGVLSGPNLGAGDWTTTALSVVLLLAGALTALGLLMHLAPRVARAPVAASVPALVLLSSGAIVGLPLQPPMGLPPLGFVLLWIPLLVIGSALGQQRGLAPKALSTLLCMLPLLLTAGTQVLAAGTLESAYGTHDVSALRFVFVVGATCIGTSLLTLTLTDITHDGVRAWAEELTAHSRAMRKKERENMAMLLGIRDSVSEERAALASEQKELDALVERAEQAMDEQAAERRALRSRGMLGKLVLGAAVLISTAVGSHYLGARSRAQAEHARSAKQQQAQVAALADQHGQLQRTHQDELDVLERRRVDANVERLAAEASLQMARDEIAVLSAQGDTAASGDATTTANTAPAVQRTAAASKPKARKTRKARSKGAGLAGRVDDDPIGGL